MSKRFFERQHSFKLIISIVWFISSNRKRNIINRRIKRQRKFFQSQRINKWLDRRSCLSWSSYHIILSLNSGIKIIYRTNIRQHITIFGIYINHRTIVRTIVLENSTIFYHGLFCYFLCFCIKRCFDNKSSFA